MKNIIIVIITFFFLFLMNSMQAQDYNNAVGVRLAWGFGATGKHFFSEKVAGEAIINYWSRGRLGYRYTRTRITALVEIHNDLSSVAEGLKWYAGGGAFVGFWGGEFGRFFEGYTSTQIGLSGVIGADYKFKDLPINVSVDWTPSIAIAGGAGFFGNAGGIAVRYTF